MLEKYDEQMDIEKVLESKFTAGKCFNKEDKVVSN